MKKLFMNAALVSLLVVAAPLHAACNTSTVIASKPDGVLRDNGDGTVYDKETGLVWMQCSQGQSGAGCAATPAIAYTWAGALAAVQAANAGVGTNGYADWRLPSTAELGSIIESACVSPAINATFFPGTQSSSYWTSSPSFTSNEKAWRVSFIEGDESVNAKDALHYVRLVRN